MRIPIITERHSSSCSDEVEVLDANALPQTLDIKAWLSLVGRPLAEAKLAQIITVIRATESEIIAERLSFPKSAMPYKVFATLGEIIDITTAPKKLQIPASKRAIFGVKARVDTHPAIALGASVQPFTRAKQSTSEEKNISICASPPLPTV